MTEIDRLSRLMAEVRSTLSDKTQKGTNASKSAKGKGGETKSIPVSAAHLRRSAINSLRALGPITSENRKMARRRFIEWAVLGELGFQLAEDASFPELCARIADALEADEDTSSRLDQFISSLVKSEKP